MKIISLVVLIIVFSFTTNVLAQSNELIPDLTNIHDSDLWGIHNREASITPEGVVGLNAQSGGGFLRLKPLNFSNGRISLDIKGRNRPGRSFVGLAFHGVNDTTFDVIYFRPFNFNNPEKKDYSVQYVSSPKYGWAKLRDEHPGKYENPLSPAPDPNDWFHVEIEVNYPKVEVFVNNSEEPVLSIEQLSQTQEGWIGFWVGNNSDGEFRDLKIKKD